MGTDLNWAWQVIEEGKGSVQATDDATAFDLKTYAALISQKPVRMMRCAS
jgi:hypothetical protein